MCWWEYKTSPASPPATEQQKREAHAYRRELVELAKRANYRVAWSQDRGGYFAQARVGQSDEWVNINDRVTGHAGATLDCRLYAGNVVGEECRLHPEIANLTVRA